LSDKLLTPSNLKTITFKLTGLDEYLKKIQEAGNNIDEAVEKALIESAKPIYDDIVTWAEKHSKSNSSTGATLKSVSMTDPMRHGNLTSVDIGIDSRVDYNAWHAVFVEYGTPKQSADPGIRNAFYHNRGRVNKIQKQILKERGIPID